MSVNHDSEPQLIIDQPHDGVEITAAGASISSGAATPSQLQQPISNVVANVAANVTPPAETQVEDETEMVAVETYNYKDVEDALKYSYTSTNTNKTHNSSIFDVIAVYLKGQKILYTEAKTYCEISLNWLMLPSIFITSAVGIMGPILKDTGYGTTITSSLSALTAFILAVITYMKLDAKAEAHRASAYKFDKLQSHVEFSSGMALFLDTYDAKKVEEIIQKVEKEVCEIKENNPFALPERIRYGFSRLYGTNVFSDIKVYHMQEVRMVTKLKDVFNDMTPIKKLKDLGEDTEADLIKYDELKEQQRELIDQILKLRWEYRQIDHTFEAEILEYRRKYKQGRLCNWCNS